MGRAVTLGRGGTRYLGAAMLVLVCVSYSSIVRAEIYRWTDENGRVHYGDKPPASAKAEDISSSTKNLNVDESQQERDKLSKIFAPETPEEKRQRQLQEQRAAQQLASQCQRAQNRLQRLQRRLVLVDETGKAYDISEKERKAMVEDLRREIQSRC